MTAFDVVVRADASAAIGTGHVYRMLSFADVLAGLGLRVAFASRALPGNINEVVVARGYCALPFEPSEDERGDMRVLLDRAGHPRWLVVDHYGLDVRWERAMRGACERIFAVDDLGRAHDADVVLDATLGDPGRYAGKLGSRTRLIAGARYALVRAQFRNLRRSPRLRDGTIRRVNVFYGGVDASGQTLRALRVLAALPHPIAIDVLAARSFAFPGELRAAARRDERVRVRIEPPDVARLLGEADVALGAGGTASWERCFAGLPAIATSVASNQNDVLRSLSDAGALAFVGDHEGIDDDDVDAALRACLADPGMVAAMGRAAWAIVEGHEAALSELSAIFRA